MRTKPTPSKDTAQIPQLESIPARTNTHESVSTLVSRVTSSKSFGARRTPATVTTSADTIAVSPSIRDASTRWPARARSYLMGPSPSQLRSAEGAGPVAVTAACCRYDAATTSMSSPPAHPVVTAAAKAAWMTTAQRVRDVLRSNIDRIPIPVAVGSREGLKDTVNGTEALPQWESKRGRGKPAAPPSVAKPGHPARSQRASSMNAAPSRVKSQGLLACWRHWRAATRISTTAMPLAESR